MAKVKANALDTKAMIKDLLKERTYAAIRAFNVLEAATRLVQAHFGEFTAAMAKLESIEEFAQDEGVYSYDDDKKTLERLHQNYKDRLKNFPFMRRDFIDIEAKSDYIQTCPEELISVEDFKHEDDDGCDTNQQL